MSIKIGFLFEASVILALKYIPLHLFVSDIFDNVTEFYYIFDIEILYLPLELDSWILFRVESEVIPFIAILEQSNCLQVLSNFAPSSYSSLDSAINVYDDTFLKITFLTVALALFKCKLDLPFSNNTFSNEISLVMTLKSIAV